MAKLNQHKKNITQKVIAVFTEKNKVRTGLAAFFPRVITIEKSVSIEVERGRQLIAVDVERCTDAQRNTFSKHTEKIFTPPYFREAWDFTECERYNVTFGQRTNPSTSDSINMINTAGKNISKMKDKIMRAVELQRAQALQTGIVQLKNGDNIDYKRKAESLVVLNGTNVWDNAGSDILGDLAKGCDFLREEGLSSGTSVNVLFGKDAMQEVLKDSEIQKLLDNRRITRGDIGMPQFNGKTGMVFHGQISTKDYKINLWTYNEFYENSDGSKSYYIDPKNVILIADDFVGKTAFTGIPGIGRTESGDKYVKPVKGDYIISDRVDEEKRAWWFEVESAPLAIPISIDRVYTIKALA